MSQNREASQVLEHDFLTTRCKILEVAAALDRLDRASDREQFQDDPRLDQFARALRALQESGPDRAEAIQLIFSDPYDPDWQRPDGSSTARRY